MNHILLFDLDGTLTDSRVGIVESVRYALQKLELPPLPEDTLLRFIGPPLEDSFRGYCHLTPEAAEEAVRLYRERYVPIGVYECLPVPGLAELCRQWKAEGCRLAVASSKPESMCRTVCDHLGLSETMEVIAGCQRGIRMSKADVIRSCIQRLGIAEEERSRCLMIGDRRFDVEGAAACGIPCVGVEFFDFALPGELAAAGAVAVVKTPAELDAFLRR